MHYGGGGSAKRSSPVQCVWAVSLLVCGCKWIRAHAHDVTRPRMCSVELIVQRSVGSPLRGGAGLPARGVWAERLRHGRCYLAQKYQEVGVVLIVRGIGRRSGAAVPAARSYGGARAEHGDEVDAAMLQVSGSIEEMHSGSGIKERGSEESWDRRR